MCKVKLFFTGMFFNSICNMTLLEKHFFLPHPRGQGSRCKGRIFACMMFYASLCNMASFSQGTRVCVRAKYLLACCCTLHSL